jgi:hypothetical protein
MKAWKPSRTGGAPFHPGAGRWALVLCLLAGLGFACSKDPSVADNPHRQHYLDATRKLFSKPLPQPILQAGFTAADRNRHPDLLLLADQGAKGKAVFVYFNRPTEGKLEQTGEPQTVAEAGEEVLHLATADFDRDHADDVILILKTGQGMRVKILFNNGKAYYYEKIKYALPPVRAGVTRVDLLDVDDDRDVDLLFSGPLLRHGDGRTDEHQFLKTMKPGQPPQRLVGEPPLAFSLQVQHALPVQDHRASPGFPMPTMMATASPTCSSCTATARTACFSITAWASSPMRRGARFPRSRTRP